MKNLQEVQSVLETASAEIDLLIGKEHSHLNSFIKNELKKLVNRVGFFTGKAASEDAPVKFAPVTKIMGEEIDIPADVDLSDLTASGEEVDVFFDKVNKLLSEIPSMDPKVVVDSYSDSDGAIVLRGVAKIVGIDDYHNIKINTSLVSKIQDKIKQDELSKVEEQEIEDALKEELAKQDKLSKVQDKPKKR